MKKHVLLLILCLSSVACGHMRDQRLAAAQPRPGEPEIDVTRRDGVPGWMCRPERITGTAVSRYVCYPEADRALAKQQVGANYYRVQ